MFALIVVLVAMFITWIPALLILSLVLGWQEYLFRSKRDYAMERILSRVGYDAILNDKVYLVVEHKQHLNPQTVVIEREGERLEVPSSVVTFDPYYLDTKGLAHKRAIERIARENKERI